MVSRTVAELMTPDPVCCTQQDAIPEVARMMVQCDCGAIPVVDNLQNRRLVGIITDRDIVCRVIAEEIDALGARVHQAMTERVVSLGPEATIDDCVRVMADHQVRRVPILDDAGRVIGIVAQADLARASVEEPELEEELVEMVEEVSEPAP